MWEKLKANWKTIVITAVAAFLAGILISGGSSRPVSSVHSHADASSESSVTWTCSMHPSIRQDHPGNCPICGMDLIPANDQQAETGDRDLTLSETAQKLASIETAPVARRQAVHEIRMVGKVAYDETREKTISAWIGGRIDDLYVDYTGAFVRKGDPLVDLYSPELYAGQQELLQALKSDVERKTEITGKRLTAARRKLRLLGLTAEQVRQVETENRLSTHIAIEAPLSGIVVHRNVVAGAYVKVGDPMYRIVDLSGVWLELDAYESDIQWIREGQDVRFQVEAYPGRTFDGKVVFVDPILNPKTRSIRVRANVSNREGLLKPDMFVHAAVSAVLNESGQVHGGRTGADPSHDPLVVPDTAVLLTGTRAVVYVEHADKPGTYEGREVQLGPRVNDGYVVLGGLKAGERVVTRGNFKIDSELQIQARPSMMYTQGGVPDVAHDQEHAAGKGAGMAGQARPVIGEQPLLGQVDAILLAYFDAAEALSGDDDALAAKKAAALKEALDQLSMKDMNHALHEAWMPHYGPLTEAAGRMTASGHINTTREAFKNVSDQLVALMGAVDYRGDFAIYRFHCPMAFDNAGADWLQNTEATANPYFGSAMFSCGSLEERIHEAASGGGR